MASIHQRSNGKWQVRWRENGKNRCQTCPTKRAAKELARRVEEVTSIGDRWIPEAEKPREPRLGAAFAAYVAERRRTVSAVTCERYDYILARYLEGKGVDVSIADGLSRDGLSAFWAEVRDSGVTERVAANYVHAVCRAWRWIWEHPTFAATTPRPQTIEMPKGRPTRVPVAPTWAQVDALIGAAEATGAPEWLIRMLIVLRCTGLRPTQVERLLWSDVDIGEGMLTIRPELGKSDREGSGRRVPLAPVLLAEMASWSRADPRVVPIEGTKSSHVCIRRLRKRAGLPDAVWAEQPRYAMRKAFITGLIMAGVHDGLVRALVGHAGVTFAHYVDPRALRQAVEKVPAIVRPVDMLAQRRAKGGA